MNEKTKERLESELNVPAPTQPVDKLRLDESPACARPRAEIAGSTPGSYAYGAYLCFADDE